MTYLCGVDERHNDRIDTVVDSRRSFTDASTLKTYNLMFNHFKTS